MNKGLKIRPARNAWLGASAAALIAGMASPGWAQEGAGPVAADPVATDAPAPSTPDEEGIIVTGFRASLNSALNLKRSETAAIDTIVAEDIGKFPDSNLAESMQRIPGVSLARGDGGEGRNISVRGLGAGFTRIRINGMEGTSQTGSSDIYGAGNSGRSFDFNVFPSEIFSSLTVRKTTSADVEEGSLGATVDLRAPKPFDYKQDLVLSATARGVYNELSKKVDPRASLLVSKQFGSFGILGSLAYTSRNIREVGYSAVDVLSSTLGGNQLGTGAAAQPFCTPIGVTPISPSPVAQAAKGATATMCSTNNPRTGSVAAYNTIMALRSAAAPNTPGSGAFFPRIPRFVNSEQDNKRYAASLTLQWQPSDDTDISIDGLFSRYDVTRRDNYIAGLSFGRNVNNNGQPMVSVRDIEFDQNGSLVYGLFDGVDVRSEGLEDHFVSTFKQVNLNFKHRFSDAFVIDGMFGVSRSLWDGKERLQTFIDAIDTDSFVIDYRDGKTVPTIGFGFDVSDPTNFAYAPALADGTVLGGFSTQGKPSRNVIDNKTFELNGTYEVADGFSIKVGGQWREGDSRARTAALYLGQNLTQMLPAGTTLASITRQIEGVDKLFGMGAPASWASVDADKWRETFGFPDSFDFCTTADCGSGTSQIRERVKSAYVMVNFDTRDFLPIPVRGDLGVRYVHTDQRSVGYLSRALATSPTGVTAVANEVNRSYEDWLPSMNLVFEFTPSLLGRLSFADVMSRPEYGPLTPSSASITATTRNGTANNPFLDPIRATTFDASLEWYFRPGSLLSVAYFHKDIKSFIQTASNQIPFNQLGLPDELLNGTNSVPTDIFTIRQPLNTPGGPLKGVEVNAQVQLDFLPGLLSNFGILANYTHVTSKIDYILQSGGTYNADLVGLSKDAASGTLFYEDDRFSIRATASYRGPYIRGIIGANGNDYQGNRGNTFVDASASYNLTKNFKLILEAQNLTDERNSLFIDSARTDTLFETRIGRTLTFGANFQF
ncbi:TonB-dependent receptor [Sphingosinicella sp. BN140058]|uniref:TonB-dependent receptor n=1 Tax=Sphingosinicella sp. BN140058 TaxID=1892855 RepID=UPI0010131EE6|nr:TonB-dependent receptor [Sphingosinicella sp. BN140058]QAY75400.1 TonB-dependent receptor [Sphingosinicella sp. BN140058]